MVMISCLKKIVTVFRNVLLMLFVFSNEDKIQCLYSDFDSLLVVNAVLFINCSGFVVVKKNSN